jgi:hypothetical protein
MALDDIAAEAVAAQTTPAPSGTPVRTLEDTMREALEEQAAKQKPANTTPVSSTKPVVAKNPYNQSKTPARTTTPVPVAPAVNVLAEEKAGVVYIDGRTATPREAKFVGTYRQSLEYGYTEEEAYARALIEWNQDTRLLPPPAPAPPEPKNNVRIQGDPKTTELFENFRSMPLQDLEKLVGVEVPRMPSQFAVDTGAYSDFLAYSAAHGVNGALATAMIEFAADLHVGNVGTEINVAEAERIFREQFAGKLSAAQLDTLIAFYKTEVLGVEEQADQGQPREGDVLLSDATDDEINSMTNEQVDAALLYELDLSPQQKSLRERRLFDQLWETWTPRQRRTLDKLGLTQDPDA